MEVRGRTWVTNEVVSQCHSVSPNTHSASHHRITHNYDYYRHCLRRDNCNLVHGTMMIVLIFAAAQVACSDLHCCNSRKAAILIEVRESNRTHLSTGGNKGSSEARTAGITCDDNLQPCCLTNLQSTGLFHPLGIQIQLRHTGVCATEHTSDLPDANDNRLPP